MKGEVLHIIKSYEKEIDHLDQFDFSSIQTADKADDKLEEGMLRFIINTMPRDIAILKIDLQQKDWTSFKFSIQKIYNKMEMLGSNELKDKCELLLKIQKNPFKRHLLDKAIGLFEHDYNVAADLIRQHFLGEQDDYRIKTA